MDRITPHRNSGLDSSNFEGRDPSKRDYQSVSALNKFYKTSRMDITADDLPQAQNTTLTVPKRGLGPRKRSIKVLEH